MKERKFTLRYVMGEILIVSIGILIAFFINNWSSKLTKEATKEDFKKSLIIDFEQNIQKLNAIIERQEEKVLALSDVIQKVEQGTYDIDQIGSVLFEERKSPTFFPIKGTFRALVSNGDIKLFSTELKRELFNLYDTNYERTVYNGVLYDEIYVDTYDVLLKDVLDYKDLHVKDEKLLKSERFTRDIMIMIDEAKSYLKLINKTKSESIRTLAIVRTSN